MMTQLLFYFQAFLFSYCWVFMSLDQINVELKQKRQRAAKSVQVNLMLQKPFTSFVFLQYRGLNLPNSRNKLSHIVENHNVFCSTLPSHCSTFWRDGFIQITIFGQQKTFSRIYVETVDFCIMQFLFFLPQIKYFCDIFQVGGGIRSEERHS